MEKRLHNCEFELVVCYVSYLYKKTICYEKVDIVKFLNHKVNERQKEAKDNTLIPQVYLSNY